MQVTHRLGQVSKGCVTRSSYLAYQIKRSTQSNRLILGPGGRTDMEDVDVINGQDLVQVVHLAIDHRPTSSAFNSTPGDAGLTHG